MAILARQFRIDWVNTVGTRRPRLRLADLARGVEKLRQHAASRPVRGGSTPAAADAGDGVFVHAPLHWPGFRYRWERALNARLLRRALAPLLLGAPAPAAVVTTVPITADLVRGAAHLPWIYYCVDDFSAWPGLDGATLGRLERDQVSRVHAVVAASEVLQARMRELGREAALLPHGVDLAAWADVAPRPRAPRDRPVALFWGLIDRRLDVEICLALAEQLTVRLLGPVQDVDVRLRAHPGVVMPGPVPYDALPGEARRADVLIMPYADLPVTRAMQPLKLLEYLATALPVVVTALPANRAWADGLDIAAGPQSFLAAVLLRLRTGLPGGQVAARRRVGTESWQAKAAQFAALCALR